MASYVVGGGGFGGLSSPLNQSLLLREQLATNVGQAGEQELAELAYSQNVVVTLPATPGSTSCCKSRPQRPIVIPPRLRDRELRRPRRRNSEGHRAEKRTEPDVRGSVGNADLGAAVATALSTAGRVADGVNLNQRSLDCAPNWKRRDRSPG